MRATLAALGLIAAVVAQEPGAAPVPTVTAAPAKLPDLGEPTPVPDGAPPQLAAITREQLRAHAYWLADDARAGRFTSSAAQLAVANYVAEHFQRLGLKPLGDKKGFLQSYPVDQIALDPATSLTLGNDKITDLAVLPAVGADKVSVSGRFAWCGKGRGDDVPANLKGKIPVVWLDKVPRGKGVAGAFAAFTLYTEIARRLGKADAAAGVVVLTGDPGPLGDIANYSGLLPDHPLLSVGGDGRTQFLPLPLLLVAGNNAGALLRHLGAKVADDGAITAPPDDAKATGKLQLLLKRSSKGSACNVVAVLEGAAQKNEALVFSAHHDHIGRRVDGDAFNGADDNASGTSGLLTIAAALAKGERPSRSIVFLSVSGEELGLWGSKWFSDHPTWPLDKIIADINIDMIGRAEADGVLTKIQITPSKDHPKYSSIGRLAAQLAPRLSVTFTSGDQYYTRSDHYNFAQKGVPVVFFCDGEHPDYHQVTDTADKLDYARMEAVARLACWTGIETAERKARPVELGAQNDW